MGIQDTCDFQTSIMGRATLKDGVPTFWGTSGRTLQWLVTAVATTDFLLFGYDQGVMSGIISSEAFVTDFPEVHNDSTYEGFVVSIYAVGCFLGALFILNFGDWLGRRRSIYIGAVVHGHWCDYPACSSARWRRCNCSVYRRTSHYRCWQWYQYINCPNLSIRVQ